MTDDTTRVPEEREPAGGPPIGSQARFSLLAKIILFLVAVLVPLAGITWFTAVRALRGSLTEEFTSKGTAIANSLASSGPDLILTRDASTVQALVDQFAAISGVAYVMVYDSQRTLVAHTFAPLVPAGLIEKNLVPGDAAKQIRDLTYPDPVTGRPTAIIDIGVPMLGGQLGTVRVGMNRAAVTAAAARSGNTLLLVFGGAAAAALLTGALFARHISRPVAQLVAGAKRVGRGDLSQLVPVTSRDELGELTTTFNQTVVRLRSQVRTEAERDEERRRREELQGNITRFLDTVMEVSQGDLTRRGVVTGDILGNVVDGVNLMVQELATVIADVRQAALRVAASSTEMVVSTGQLATGAQAQSREAMGMTRAVEELNGSVRQAAESAEASALAGREALDAAQKGERAVRNSLEGIQKIRGEMQGISRKMKSLGDRSVEISEIVDTIRDIAFQTDLLALNAAIEAAGAGEAGLRFAAVAEEVRKLAERAGSATRHIATLVKNVQLEMQEAIVATENGTGEVEAGYRIAVETGRTFKEIAEIVQRSAKLCQEIFLATQEQVRGAGGVATGAQSIAVVAVESEHAVVRTRKTAEELGHLAQELTQGLSRFRLAS